MALGKSTRNVMENRADALIKSAKLLLCKPYRYGAKPEEAPEVFDCSSFTQYLYQIIGIDLPRKSIDQAMLGREVEPKVDQLQDGDLIFIRGKWGRYNPDFPQGIGHVAMYVGGGKVINARWKSENEGGGSVIEEPIEDFLKRDDLTVIKRLI